MNVRAEEQKEIRQNVERVFLSGENTVLFHLCLHVSLRSLNFLQ